MKKILISSTFIVFFAAYIGYQSLGDGRFDTDAMPIPTPASQTLSNQSSANSGNSAPPPSTTSQKNNIPQTTAVAASFYTDGTYTGSVANAYYGPLQVSVTISGGKIADVRFLQYPNDRRESQQVSSYSLPILRNEAVSAQSAQVDGVSGATQTSMAFDQSLATALSQARS